MAKKPNPSAPVRRKLTIRRREEEREEGRAFERERPLREEAEDLHNRFTRVSFFSLLGGIFLAGLGGPFPLLIVPILIYLMIKNDKIRTHYKLWWRPYVHERRYLFDPSPHARWKGKRKSACRRHDHRLTGLPRLHG